MSVMVGGCEGGDYALPASEGTVEQTEQSIINGTPLASDDLGLVKLTFPVPQGIGMCSGTLLNGNWILTAKHCVLAEASGYRIRVGTSTTDHPARVAQIIEHDTYDVALFRTDRVINNPATGAPFVNHLYAGTTGSLVNATVDCRGYGLNTYDSGAGVLRQANLTVGEVGEYSYTAVKNASGQVQWEGDSGGPCAYTTGGVRYVLGAMSTCEFEESKKNVVSCGSTAASAFRNWAYQHIGVGPNGGSWRNGNEYRTYVGPVSWAQADSDCQARRGHLATFTSQAELDFMRALIPTGVYHAWIGLTDVGHEGTWTWVTGEPVVLAPWRRGEPNNAGGAEHWAELPPDGKMNDLPASWTAAYICEWEAHSGSMFGGHEYQGYKASRVWDDAKWDCETLGGHLVTISSAAENSFVSSIVPSFHNWIGLHDKYWNGTWTWVTDEPLSFTRWTRGEPNNIGSEPCVEISWGGGGEWNNLPYNWGISYVCEWPARVP